MTELLHIREQTLASAILFASAGKASAVLDAFSSWLIVGYAAVLALLLDKGEKYLPAETLHYIMGLFLLVALFGIVAKFLSAMVSGASAGNAIGRKLTGKLLSAGSPFSVAIFSEQYMKGIPWPARWFLRGTAARVRAGNLLDGPRSLLQLLQVQGLVTVGQAACVVSAIYTVAKNGAF